MEKEIELLKQQIEQLKFELFASDSSYNQLKKAADDMYYDLELECPNCDSVNNYKKLTEC